MATSEQERFVIRELVKYRKRDDIILALCDQYSITWPEAEAIMHRVELDGAHEIESQRRPFLRMIAIITIVAGLSLALGMIFLALAGYWVPFFYVPLLGNIVYSVVGIGMTIGGMIGLKDLRR